MEEFKRFAVYAMPPPGAWAAFAAAWLGWDPVTGQEVAHPDVSGLPRPVADITATPRKYGFHGTLKPPFRPAGDATADGLSSAVAGLAATSVPVTIPRLVVSRLGRFVALVPEARVPALDALAARVVADLDGFRAPPDAAELARRRRAGLSAAQEALLLRWGYPYVMEEFRFHMTLSGPLEEAEADAVVTALRPEFDGRVPAPWQLDALALVGEGPDGRFRLVHRYTLSG